jgi:ATP-binding cassette subfamily B protein
MHQLDVTPERAASRNLKQLTPALRFLRPYVWQVVGASIALIVTAGVTLSIGQGIRYVIDAGFDSGSPAMLSETMGVFIALVVLLTIGTYARFYLVSWVGERVSADLRSAVFRHLVYLHPGFFEANLPTEIQSRITTDTTVLQGVIGSSVSIALRNILMLLGGIVLLVASNPRLSLLVLACAPVVVAPIVLFGRRVRNLSRSSQDTLARVGSYVGEAFRHIKVVQAFNHQPQDVAAFQRHVEAAFAVAARRIRQRAWLIACVMLLVFCAVALLFWVGGQDVLSGRTSVGELAAFVFYAIIVAGAVGALSEVVSDLQRAAGATERLVELLESESPLIEKPGARRQWSDAPAVLTLDQVSFAYPTRAITVLKDVSFEVGSGQTVALVGPSGAGKSTLFDLIMRFYDPRSGCVKIDGQDVRDCALDDLRAQIAFVPQDPILFSGTIAENLRYGAPDATEAALQGALTEAHAATFVAQLPDGLGTLIGEDGVGLSGGQRQRLAIARALLKRPRLLLMDEATSALDAQSEEAIRRTLRGLRGRCSVLIIAHRLSTVLEADRIIVLDGGRVVGSGTHESLLDDSPLYREFADIQFTSDGAQTLH